MTDPRDPDFDTTEHEGEEAMMDSRIDDLWKDKDGVADAIYNFFADDRDNHCALLALRECMNKAPKDKDHPVHTCTLAFSSSLVKKLIESINEEFTEAVEREMNR